MSQAMNLISDTTSLRTLYSAQLRLTFVTLKIN